MEELVFVIDRIFYEFAKLLNNLRLGPEKTEKGPGRDSNPGPSGPQPDALPLGHPGHIKILPFLFL